MTSMYKLSKIIEKERVKNVNEFVNASTSHDMIGLNPITTIVNDITGNKQHFDVKRMI